MRAQGDAVLLDESLFELDVDTFRKILSYLFGYTDIKSFFRSIDQYAI